MCFRGLKFTYRTKPGSKRFTSMLAALQPENAVLINVL